MRPTSSRACGPPANAATMVHGACRTLSCHPPRSRSSLRSVRIIFPFDYRTWWNDYGRRFVAAPDALGEATLDDVRRLMTVHIRNDRFVEGHLLDAFESGHIVRVLERIAT